MFGICKAINEFQVAVKNKRPTAFINDPQNAFRRNIFKDPQETKAISNSKGKKNLAG